MLTRIADGVWIHESGFIQSNSVIVQGTAGVLLVDPGISAAELACLADDLRELGAPVVAGFSTHPHWDHVLWHSSFGDVPRFGTAGCAAAMRHLLSSPDWTSRVADVLPPELANEVPLDFFGRVVALPSGATHLPWDGPRIRVLEHRAHSPGHAALLIEGARVLVAGDMLSDILMPFLDLEAADPLNDYLAALELFDSVAGGADVVVPGHGSVGGSGQVQARIELDRAYVRSIQDGTEPSDPRLGPHAPLDWLQAVHKWQSQRLAQRGEQDTTPE